MKKKENYFGAAIDNRQVQVDTAHVDQTEPPLQLFSTALPKTEVACEILLAILCIDRSKKCYLRSTNLLSIELNASLNVSSS